MKRETKKELQKRIEELEEYISDADGAYLDLREAQELYKKRYGKEYQY